MRSLPEGIEAVLSYQRAMDRRIMWVTGSYYPDVGGAEISLMSRASLLKRHFGQVVLTGTSHGNRVVDGIPVLEMGGTLESSMLIVIEQFQPDYIAASGRLSVPALAIAVAQSLPCLYFMSAPTNADFTDFLGSGLLRVIANSDWVGETFANRWGYRPLVLDPPVLDWQVVAGNREKSRSSPTVTHVGDSYVKGGLRVLRIAEQMPTAHFLVTQNWPSMRGTSGWDQEKVRELRQTEGATTLFEEQLPDFTPLSNVVCRSPFQDVRALYAQTDVIIVASVWREPFGRVVVEGLLNDLPVVVSPEVYHDRWEGLVYLVENPESATAWRETILNALEGYPTSDIRKRGETYRRGYSAGSLRTALLTKLFGTEVL